MTYLIRRVFFVGNILLLMIGFACCIYAIVRWILEPDAWLFALLLFAIGFLAQLLFSGLYLLRKKRFPLPGIDYK
ncbi:MAG: hypothetical protein JXA23_02615 [Bacteroidales bacterium]|nr:hypothetical protein [Bacteroidales bacterium]